jgi:hypothetical protein
LLSKVALVNLGEVELPDIVLRFNEFAVVVAPAIIGSNKFLTDMSSLYSAFIAYTDQV